MKSFTTLAMFAGLLMFSALGCSQSTETETAPAGASSTPGASHDEMGHEHDADGNDLDAPGDTEEL